MKQKDYSLGLKAREAGKDVARIVQEIVGATLGPGGRNFYIPNGITNDGSTIMKHLRFEDPAQNHISYALEEIARKTDADAGDGTTTATVLGCQLYQDTVDQVPDLDAPIASAKTLNDIFAELDKETEKAISLIKPKKIKSVEELKKVALTAMEYEEHANLVAETVFKAGKEGTVALEEGVDGGVSAEFRKGFKIEASIASPAMYNSNNGVEHNGLPVLVANHLFEDYSELAPLLEDVVANGTQYSGLIIVGKKFKVNFVKQMVVMSRQHNIPFVLLENNYLSDDTFKDVAAFTGATVIDTNPAGGELIQSARAYHLGFAEKLIADGTYATFSGKPNPDLKEYLDTLREKKQDERVAALTGSIAVIYYDAKTAVDKYYLKLKLEDTINSCVNALKDGMVEGGGKTFDEIAEKLGKDSILYNTLKTPKRTITKNLGFKTVDTEAFDSFTTAKNGLLNAVSVVKKLLSVEGVITDVDQSMVEALKDAVTPKLPG